MAQALGPVALGALPIIKSKGVVLLASLWLPTRVKIAWPIKGGCHVEVLSGSNVTSECLQKTQDFKTGDRYP